MKKQSEEDTITKVSRFLDKVYHKELIKASTEGEPLVIDYLKLHKFDTELSDVLLSNPKKFFEMVTESLERIEDLPNPVIVKIQNIEVTNIRDLRSKNIGKFLCIEGIVRKSSEIRPEIVETIWECPKCGRFSQPAKAGMVFKPFQCPICAGKKGLKEVDKKMVDTRWIVIEEPFELTEGEKPSQLTVLLKEDLVGREGRRTSDPGNRLRIYGVLRDIPKGGKTFSVKLDFYMDANFVEPTEIGWKHIEITKEDEDAIKEMAKDPLIYEKLIDSLAPSLYGLREVKEAIILQLFGGVERRLKDKMRFRGDIHVLLIGDPSSGKSQLLKLVPEIVPRGKYVSGKGVTGAGLTATVTKDEQFMGGWVLEAGALVLTNRGLLAIDEFEKMSPDDQVAMHEALEQGSISIAKASIVATLPAQTSVLAGGNPKFSRFDPYMPIAKQITIPETLLARFDLKFAIRDLPEAEMDKRIVEHVLRTRDDEDEEATKPRIEPEMIRKYIAYCRDKKPKLTKDAGKVMKKFYIDMRSKGQPGGPVPITLRQFEALIRLAEASAKIQLSETVRREDVNRAVSLMRFSLQQLGFDTETGKIDIDRTEGAVTSSERSKIRVVLDLINDLSVKTKEIPVEEIRKQAKAQGIEEIDEIIEKLKREGMLFEPSPGYVQKV
jgi:replicative DNA helicase Mcm